MIRSNNLLYTAATACLIMPASAGAQVILDRADPTITERALPTIGTDDRLQNRTPEFQAAPAATPASDLQVAPQAIIVTGSELPPTVFADVILRYVGRELGRADLSALVSDVAAEARRAGYPLATAAIDAQDMAGGVLRVRVDDGRIDAVRVIGATNPFADRLLSRMLATGKPLRRATLERAILLTGDLPGLSVRESRLVRQDGFNILLVTVEQDRSSAYVQLDNRGSEEVGPIRSTILGSVRGLLQPGDEAAVLLSNTAPQLSEFAFFRGRYSMPVGSSGGIVSVAGSYGRSNPGGTLKALDIVGESADAALTFAQPIARSRSASLTASVELRHIRIDQRITSIPLRQDRLDTLTATLDGVTRLAGGTARGQFLFVAGLPLGGVTREGEPLASRADGDARFVTLGFTADWTTKLSPSFTLVVAAAGQIASRPLLATAELGVGGPGFGRAYDYAERTGDEGVLGSAEVRLDTGRLAPGVIERSHLYGFVDGGTVSNRGRGSGGGSLASTGAGMRLGIGRMDGSAEIALPLNADRLDTGDRRPRISLRIARSF